MTETSTTPSRLLQWEGCSNARDLGGYVAADGRETRWGAVARSDNPELLTTAGRSAVVAAGIRTVIDLRMPEECWLHPNPFAEGGDHGIAYYHVSMLDPAVTPDPLPTLADDYIRWLESYGSAFREIMRIVAEAPPGGVLVHCMAGKDRTGVVCALLLAIAGVPAQTIGQDYALTTECRRAEDSEWLENGPGERADREAAFARSSARAEVMTTVLAHLDRAYGGAEGYLRHVGVTGEEIERLRRRMLG